MCNRIILSPTLKDVHSLIYGTYKNVILQGERDFAEVIKLGSLDGDTILDYFGGPSINRKVLITAGKRQKNHW